MSNNKDLCFFCLNQGFPCFLHDETVREFKGTIYTDQDIPVTKMLEFFSQEMISFFNCKWWYFYKKHNHLREAEYWHIKMTYEQNRHK